MGWRHGVYVQCPACITILGVRGIAVAAATTGSSWGIGANEADRQKLRGTERALIWIFKYPPLLSGLQLRQGKETCLLFPPLRFTTTLQLDSWTDRQAEATINRGINATFIAREWGIIYYLFVINFNCPPYANATKSKRWTLALCLRGHSV